MHLKELDANLLVVLDALLIDPSVTRVAGRLGRSPSAISHALRHLRTAFDDELFLRAGQKLVATAKAREIAPLVHVTVAGMESLLRNAESIEPNTQFRQFAFACPEIYEPSLVQPLRKIFAAEAPTFSLTVRPPEERQRNGLREDSFQFLIANTIDHKMADLCGHRLFDDRMVTLTGRPASESAQEAASATAFAEAPHIVVDAVGIADPIDDCLKRLGLARRIAVRTPSLFSGVMMALETGALLTLPGSIAGKIAKLTPLRPLAQLFPPASVPVYLAWHRTYDRDDSHQWVRDRIFDLAAEAQQPSKLLCSAMSC